MASERITTAAGGIVWRRLPVARRDLADATRNSIELLLIHRPTYDDWTFPKGKVDPGETLPQTAVREIWEETGLTVRLGHPLPRVDYQVSAGAKQVSYWSARQIGTDESPFTPNREVDEVRWVRVRDAADLLTYDYDRTLLDEFRKLREHQGHRTRTLVVLRHAKATPRSSFGGDDRDRPLATAGIRRAADLVPVLQAYGARRVVSSPALRCAQTLEPYAHAISTFIEIDDRLSEQTGAAQVRRSVEALMDRKKPVVLCSHRPTLPWIFDAIGIRAVDLDPGDGVVVHHRKGRVLATERLQRLASQRSS